MFFFFFSAHGRLLDNYHHIKKVSADSELSKKFSAEKVVDSLATSAWCEGVNGSGKGQKIKFEFTHAVPLKRIEILNGYFRSSEVGDDLWVANSRVKKLKVYVESSDPSEWSLIDSFRQLTTTEDYDYRYHFVNKIEFGVAPITSKVEFEIIDTYKGKTFDDTCISEIVFYSDSSVLKRYADDILSSQKNPTALDKVMAEIKRKKLDFNDIATFFGNYNRHVLEASRLLNKYGIKEISPTYVDPEDF